MFQPIDQHLEAGGEPLVAVVDPDVLAEGDQGGEAVGGQRAEELVQLGSNRCIADPLLVDGGARAADGKADGVVDQQEEGQPGFAVAEPGRLQRGQDRLDEGQGVGAERVAGLEDPGDCGCQLFGLSHAACAYSWISPPSRSRRTILPAGRRTGGSAGPSGGAGPRARCGRLPLE